MSVIVSRYYHSFVYYTKILQWTEVSREMSITYTTQFQKLERYTSITNNSPKYKSNQPVYFRHISSRSRLTFVHKDDQSFTNTGVLFLTLSNCNTIPPLMTFHHILVCSIDFCICKCSYTNSPTKSANTLEEIYL